MPGLPGDGGLPVSAFVVAEAHLDYLIAAGLRYGHDADRTLRWHVPDPPLPTDHRRGEPWGPTAIAHAEATERQLRPDTADAVGEMLLVQNERSYDHRHAGQHPTARLAYRFTERGRWAKVEGRVDAGWLMRGVRLEPVAALKALSCYEYQSCEDPGWQGSEARAFCDSLRRCLIAALPGYEAAPWDLQPAPPDAPATPTWVEAET